MIGFSLMYPSELWRWEATTAKAVREVCVD